MCISFAPDHFRRSFPVPLPGEGKAARWEQSFGVEGSYSTNDMSVNKNHLGSPSGARYFWEPILMS